MRQRILGSHTPPCHRRMVITTQFSVLPCCPAAQPVLYNSRRLLIVLWPWPSVHVGQLAPTTLPQCRLVSNPCSAGLSLSLWPFALWASLSFSVPVVRAWGGGSPCRFIPRAPLSGAVGFGGRGVGGPVACRQAPGGGGGHSHKSLGCWRAPCPRGTVRRLPSGGGCDPCCSSAVLPGASKHTSGREGSHAVRRPMCMCLGMPGFHFGGGGGSIEPPKTGGGGGFGKRAQLTGTIHQSL